MQQQQFAPPTPEPGARPGFDLGEIKETIQGKKKIFAQVAQKSYGVDETTAENIVDGEMENFLIRLYKYDCDPKNSGATITPAQGANIFLEVLQSGLSFSEVAGHVYVSRLKGSGSGVSYQVTVDGAVYLAQKAGAIDHLSEPVIVMLGEHFRIFNTPEGKHVADHHISFDGRPPFSFDKFLVGYIYIVYPNGDRELSWIDVNKMRKRREKSMKQASYNDESFIQTKIILNALRKVRKSEFMQKIRNEDEEVIAEHREWEDSAPVETTYMPPLQPAPPAETAPQPTRIPTQQYVSQQDPIANTGKTMAPPPPPGPTPMQYRHPTQPPPQYSQPAPQYKEPF